MFLLCVPLLNSQDTSIKLLSFFRVDGRGARRFSAYGGSPYDFSYRTETFESIQPRKFYNQNPAIFFGISLTYPVLFLTT